MALSTLSTDDGRGEEAMLRFASLKSSEDEVPSAQDKNAVQRAAPADSISKEPAQELSSVTAASDEVASSPSISGPATSTADSGRTITVFSPPSEDIPSSAKLDYNESDYIPSIEHAKLHQRLLNESSRPKRLPTDAEIAAKAEAEAARRAAIHEVNVKIRFPDQSQVVASFGTSDTGQSLYEFARGCLTPPFASESFTLTVHGVSRSKHTNVIPPSDKKHLIKDLELAGRVLVNFSWADNAASFVHERRSEILRSELRSQAQELKVEQPPELKEDVPAPSQPGPSSAQVGNKPSGTRKSGGIPKWLKLPGKK
ncbi:hypothetical protein PDIDSM_4099 [Penicillium digitatum]|nr:hypothetical protein PDIDSM_4099 [Penicillium digitatum]